MRELPAPPTLMSWFAPFGGRLHAFAAGQRSLCEKVRFSAVLDPDPTAQQCPECVHLARVALNAALDRIVDDGASAEWAHLDLQNRMTEPELVHAKGGISAD